MDLDPLSVPALVATLTAVLAGTAGEAGVQAWHALAGLVQRMFGSGSPARDLTERDPGALEPDPAAVETLARHLAARALTDPVFAAALQSWAASTASVDAPGSVTNIVDGNARVDGGLVQTHTIHGNITLGGSGHGA
ncbi:hypothetical protein [Frankia sp. R82]|uniref:hypothetical protein n=1 Tax=Frankia sp. R82 TaxID=2950553 RepID=UPI002044CDCE|nr:hypothetical protein [Frankia sp. R82]MCM3886808.1 hypothetical protein [Frankia sp. R82]